jgi:hypothetical protein
MEFATMAPWPMMMWWCTLRASLNALAKLAAPVAGSPALSGPFSSELIEAATDSMWPSSSVAMLEIGA